MCKEYFSIGGKNMKVILLNGSSHNDGATASLLKEIEDTLKGEDIETEVFFIGNDAIRDCVGCRKCASLGKCVFDDKVNEFVEKARSADGFVFASPVYYAHPSGRLLSFLDRAFYSGSSAFFHKPAAAVLSARRAGTVASYDVINKYFGITSMPIVTATYWNQGYGNNKAESMQDTEGHDTMKNLALNMAWLLKCIDAGKKLGIDAPENKKRAMNFIR